MKDLEAFNHKGIVEPDRPRNSQNPLNPNVTQQDLPADGKTHAGLGGFEQKAQVGSAGTCR